MYLSHSTPAALCSLPAGNRDVEDLVAVMDMLRSIMAEENDFLRCGLPASLYEWKEFKQDLAEQYDAISRRVAAEIADGVHPDPDIVRTLVEQTRALKGLADENLRLLDGAVTATRRRIEAVITAAHAGEATTSRYDGKGVAAVSCFVPRVARMSA